MLSYINDTEDHNLDCHLHGESADNDYVSYVSEL